MDYAMFIFAFFIVLIFPIIGQLADNTISNNSLPPVFVIESIEHDTDGMMNIDFHVENHNDFPIAIAVTNIDSFSVSSANIYDDMWDCVASGEIDREVVISKHGNIIIIEPSSSVTIKTRSTYIGTKHINMIGKEFEWLKTSGWYKIQLIYMTPTNDIKYLWNDVRNPDNEMLLSNKYDIWLSK